MAGISEWQEVAGGAGAVTLGLIAAYKWMFGAASLERDKHQAEMGQELDRRQQSEAHLRLAFDLERDLRYTAEQEVQTWKLRALTAEAKCRIVKEKSGEPTPLPSEVKQELADHGIELPK